MEYLDKNNDGQIDFNDIYYIILELMKKQVKKKNIGGSAKHYSVMIQLKNLLGIEKFKQFEPLLDKAIDFIFDIANHKNLLKTIKKNCKCK
jgi:hypothetical protein